MNEKITCARRIEDGLGDASSPFKLAGPNLDSYGSDDTCSYCGSFNPDTLIARLEAGDVELVPTDKNYKVYVHSVGGASFKQSYRDCPSDEKIVDGKRITTKCAGPDTCTHWITRESPQTKFYFQHFSTEQKKRFIELLNEKKIKIGYPGRFYVWPFFVAPQSS